MNSHERSPFPPLVKGRLHNFFHLCILRSWWVILVAAFAYLLFLQGMHKKRLDYHEMQQRLNKLGSEKKSALAEQEDLLLQINSQSDPAYIQMVLMKQLGVVPQGQTKVYFQEE